jgi:hypothetical protein
MRLKLSASKSVKATDLAVDSVKSFKVGDKLTSGDNWIQISDVQVALPSTGPVVAVKFMVQMDGQRSADTLMLPDFLKYVNEKFDAKLALSHAAKTK